MLSLTRSSWIWCYFLYTTLSYFSILPLIHPSSDDGSSPTSRPTFPLLLGSPNTHTGWPTHPKYVIEIWFKKLKANLILCTQVHYKVLLKKRGLCKACNLKKKNDSDQSLSPFPQWHTRPRLHQHNPLSNRCRFYPGIHMGIHRAPRDSSLWPWWYSLNGEKL